MRLAVALSFFILLRLVDEKWRKERERKEKERGEKKRKRKEERGISLSKDRFHRHWGRETNLAGLNCLFRLLMGFDVGVSTPGFSFVLLELVFHLSFSQWAILGFPHSSF
jgi:hypothetical protein